MSGPRVNWRRELILVSLVGMDVTWLTPWTVLLTGTAYEPTRRLAGPALLLLLLGALAVTRILGASGLALERQQLISGMLAIASGFLLIGVCLYGGRGLADWLGELVHLAGRGPAGLALLGVALYSWWRGMSLAQARLGADSVGFYLRWGVVAWLWLYLIGLMAPVEAPVGGLFLYFALGLLAVGLSRVEEMRRGRGAVRSPFAAWWLLVMGGSALAAMGLGLAATFAVSPRLLGALWKLLSPARAVLWWAFYGWVQLMFLVLAPLVEWLRVALGPKLEGVLGQPAPVPTVAPFEPVHTRGLPVPIQVLLWAAVGLAFLAVVAFVVLGLRRREAEGDHWATREAAWEGAPGERGGRRASTLQRLRDRLAFKLGALRSPAYRLATAREIYASLQRLAAWKGAPRQEAETPYEFEERLDEVWAATRRQVASITEAYVQAHYGERPVSEGELVALRADWERLRQAVEGPEAPES